jgi:hypothetical protein
MTPSFPASSTTVGSFLGGLNCGKGRGLWGGWALFGGFGGGFFDWLSGHDFEEQADGALWVDGDFVDVGFGGQDSQFGVGGDLFYGFGLFGLAALFCGLWFGEVEAGDLEAVEEEAGTPRVDVVGGDAAENFDDGGLKAGAVVRVGDGEVEGGLAVSTGSRVLCGFAGGVVVVAEFFAAEADAAAAVAVGEDVSALVAFWFCLGHRVASLLVNCAKYSK